MRQFRSRGTKTDTNLRHLGKARRLGIALLAVGIWAYPAARVSAQEVVARDYDVRELVATNSDYPATQHLGIVEQKPAAAPAARPSGEQQRQQVVDRIIKSVQQIVADDPAAVVTEQNGQLHVSARGELQQRVSDTIEQAKSDRQTQVSIQYYCLTVDRSVITGLSPSLRAKFDQLGVAVNPQVMIDENEQAAIMDAVKKSAAASLLIAPRTTLFQNQKAYSIISTSTSYVRAIDTVTGPNGAAAYQPQTGQVQSGILVESHVHASADRSTIAVDMHLEMARLRGLDSVQMPARPGAPVLSYQVPAIDSSEARQLMTFNKGRRALIRLDQGEDNAKDALDRIEFVIVVPTLINAKPA